MEPIPIPKQSDINEERKKEIIHDLNVKIGGDINELQNAYDLESKLMVKRDFLYSSLNIAQNEVPTKISSAIKKAESNSLQIDKLKSRSELLKTKVEDFMNKTEPFRAELNSRFAAISKLEQVVVYLKTLEKIDDLSRQMKQSSDDEQLVLLYNELKDMCGLYQKGHRAAYVKDYTWYWHSALKEKLSKHYEDVLKQLKWPFVNGVDSSPPPKEVLIKFTNLTRYLFLIQEPEDFTNITPGDFGPDIEPSLPVRLLLRPLKKRFAFHFTGPRQTARIDRPEWFLTQTLTWIKDHQGFVRSHVQPVADKLDMRNVRAVDEFNAGLISMASERLHNVLAIYHAQSSKGDIVDIDAAFAHAVDETLGFHRELVNVTGRDGDAVLSVLTKAETFVRWLAVEKKYALAKMDEALSSRQWSVAVGSGAQAAVGSLVWVPRAADWLVALLATLQDRHAQLPQPGHRLQFLELQLELIEEWRVRLTQLLGAALNSLAPDSFLSPSSTPHPLVAVINAAHHTREVMLQWAHSLHYLQLHYYRSQFQHFTQQHHDDEPGSDDDGTRDSTESGSEDAISLTEVEDRAKKMALDDVTRRDSAIIDQNLTAYDISGLPKLPIADEGLASEAGVFSEAVGLFTRLRDKGLAALAEHLFAEFKADVKDYKKEKWHALVMETGAEGVESGALCGALAALCARLSAPALPPALAAALRARLANLVDNHLFQEVVLENWFNAGGTVQFTHHVKRNLVPAFTPLNKLAYNTNHLPKLQEACKILNMSTDDARRLRGLLAKQPQAGLEVLKNEQITHIKPSEVLRILTQRTDLCESTTPTSVMELF